MNKQVLRGIKFLCMIPVVAAMDAVATGVQVDGGDILPSNLIQSIVIENNIIKVETNTTNPWNIVQDVGNPDLPQVNLLANGQSEIEIPLGQDVTISWDVSNSTSCDTTGGTSEWNTLVITPDQNGDAQGNIDITVDFQTPTDFNLQCTDGVNNDSDGVTVTGTLDIPDPVVTLEVENQTSFTVDKDTDTVLTFDWVVSNSITCDGNLGNAEWNAISFNPVNGSDTNSTDITVNISSDTVFELSCEGDGTSPVTVTDQVTVFVATEECPVDWIAPLAEGLTENQRDNLETTWEDVFVGFGFPFPRFASKDITVSRARYRAIEFNTGDNTGLDGGIVSVTHTATYGSRRGAISRCPGDFSQHLPDTESACTETWFIDGALNWTTGSNPQSFECELQPETTYWLNITFTDGTNTETDQCSGSVCRTTLDIFHF